MALPRKHRLLVDKANLSLFKKRGKKTVTPLLSAYSIQGGNRFAIVVSSHVSKKAVDRNRLRRLIHGAIVANMPKVPKIDMILFPKKQMVHCNREEIVKEVAMLFKKIHI